MDRKIEKGQIIRLIAAFILATLSLSLVFIVVNSVTYIDYINSKQQTNAISDSIAYITKNEMNLNCSSNFFQSTSEKLDSVARSMGILESQWGINDPRILEEKKLYSQLEQEHLKIILELNKKCNDNFIPILFFYSNSPRLKDQSDDVGFILGSFRQSHSGKVLVYSFDYNLNSSAIEQMKEQYHITYAPSIAIGKNWTIFTPNNIDNLTSYLNQ